jgi:guanylate kinase
MIPHSKGALWIVSAPSGAGKTSLVKTVVAEMSNICVSISYTTRARRAHEQEGVDYYFVTEAVFQAMLSQDLFLEHARVFGHFYGTSKVWVEAARNKGLDVILEIDWQGAEQVRCQDLAAESVFILPLGHDVLRERLAKRHQQDSAMVESRMQEAKAHLEHYKDYDYLIINDQFSIALRDLKAVIQSSRLRFARQQEKEAVLLQRLLS